MNPLWPCEALLEMQGVWMVGRYVVIVVCKWEDGQMKAWEVQKTYCFFSQKGESKICS